MLRSAVVSRFLALCHSPPSTVRELSCSAQLLNFWEPDRKGGYRTKIKKLPPAQHLREGLSMLGEEVAKFKQEAICHFRCDSIAPLYHGDFEVVWKFDSSEAVNDWVVSADQDHNQGRSSAEFVLGSHRHGVFRGSLNTTVPKDGIVKNAGYCNIRSPKNYISFKRARPYAWSLFTHMVMRVRGDGRTYQINLNMDREWDIQWHDQYGYALFTRGGPYWQISKIPFSKFYLSGKGRIQDKQEAIQLDRISTMGITIADAVNGPFQLEIDYIALIYDSTTSTNFDYEMYPASPSVFS